MCQPRGTPRYRDMSGCGCGCEWGPLFRPFFSTKEEQERLETYRNQLKKELAGVEQRIKELKGK